MKEFCILFLSGEQVQVCCFRKNTGRFRLKEHASCPLNQTDPAETCRKLLHQTGYSKDTPLIVSCAMKDGVFFRCSSVRLAADAMRNALEFELPRRLDKRERFDIARDRDFDEASAKPISISTL